ncbi:TPA: DUF2627 domain-containing protein, partial [Escherichia coli]
MCGIFSKEVLSKHV